MVSVHVWLPTASLMGHTSLTVNVNYFSFWPEENPGKKDAKKLTSRNGVLINSLQQDIVAEGNRQPETIHIANLEEGKVIAYIANAIENTPRYKLATYNCSHAVVGALMAGTTQKPSFTPDAGEYFTLGKILGSGIWTPSSVLRFAKELKKVNESNLPS